MTKKIIIGGVGVGLVMLGIVLTFKYWIFLQMVFSGVIGPALAVAGMVLLTLIRE